MNLVASRLSVRQRAAVELVGSGRCYKDAAATLGISENTLREYLRRARLRAEVSSVRALYWLVSHEMATRHARRIPASSEYQRSLWDTVLV